MNILSFLHFYQTVLLYLNIVINSFCINTQDKQGRIPALAPHIGNSTNERYFAKGHFAPKAAFYSASEKVTVKLSYVK